MAFLCWQLTLRMAFLRWRMDFAVRNRIKEGRIWKVVAFVYARSREVVSRCSIHLRRSLIDHLAEKDKP